MADDADTGVVDVRQGADVDHDPVRTPCPHGYLAAVGVTGPLAAWVQQACQSVAEIAVVAGNIVVAECKHRIAVVSQLLAGLVHVGQGGAEV